MTWLLIAYAEFVVMAVIILPNPYSIYNTVNMILFNILSFLAYASHMRTMFSDPVIILNAFRFASLQFSFTSSRYAGSRSEGHRHQGDDPASGLQGGPGVLQVPEVLQHQTGARPSLFGVPAMHPEDGPPLSVGEQLRGRE